MQSGTGDEVWRVRELTSESASMADFVVVLDIEVAVILMCGLCRYMLSGGERKSR